MRCGRDGHWGGWGGWKVDVPEATWLFRFSTSVRRLFSSGWEFDWASSDALIASIFPL